MLKDFAIAFCSGYLSSSGFRSFTLLVLICLSAFQINGQELSKIAEKIRVDYKIPALGYAVVSSDSVLEIQMLGFKRVNSKFHTAAPK